MKQTLSEIEELRSKIIKQSDQLGSKPRFGLFSHPISTAVGDNGQYQQVQHPRRQDNKPFTQRRNVVVAHQQTGQMDSCYFGPLNPLKTMRMNQITVKKLMKDKKSFHQKNFIPSAGSKILCSPTYDYKEDPPVVKDPRRKRNSEGGVITQMKNISTNCTKTIQRDLFRQPEYMDDPYDNSKQLQKKRRNSLNNVKHQLSFRLGAWVPKIFNKQRNIYGTQVKLKEKKRAKSQKMMHHEQSFKCSSPNKHGIYGYFLPFPPHQSEILLLDKTIRSKGDSQDRKPFVAMSVSKSRPSTSITSNPLNMRKHIIHSFNHRF